MENFLLLNIRSLRQNLEQLEVFLDELPTKPIAIVLTETRSSNDENHNPQRIDFYRPIKTCSRDSKGGGVGIFVHEDAEVLETYRSSVRNVQIISLEIKFNGNTVILTAVYKSPNYPIDEFLNQLSDHIMNIKTNSNKKHIVCGDFNVNLLIENNSTKKLLELMSFFNLNLQSNRLITRETGQSRTAIDHFFANFNSKCWVNKTEISDHYSVFFSTEFIQENKNSEAHFLSKQLHKLNSLDTRKDLNFEVYQQLKCKNFEHFENPDEAIKSLQKLILEAKEKIIPTKKITLRKEDKIWVTAKIKNLAKKKQNLFQA